MSLLFSSVIARTVAGLSKLSGQGEATSAPGLAALKLDPHVVQRASSQLAGSVVVTGTNGKTTTSHFIGSILAATGRPYLHNHSGSNLLRGLASSLLLNSRRGKWGLFEVDEATMPAACRDLQPNVVVVTNLFRDQLDRYGELHATAELIRKGLRVLPPGSTIILNADDPLVAALGAGLPQRVLYFGLNDTAVAEDELPESADSIITAGGELLEYSAVFLGHLGHYRSPAGDVQRPKPDVVATKVQLQGTTGSRLTVHVGRKSQRLELQLPGLYNVYNATAALATAEALDIAPATAAAAVSKTAAAFGRVELVKWQGRRIWMGLIKNPVGASEVLRTLALDDQPKHLLIVINDNFADGTDVSWLWDAEFERVVPQLASVVVSGTRAADMALRLKYAGVDAAEINVINEPAEAFETAVKAVPRGQTLYVLPTYTAMLKLRQQLKRSGVIKEYLR